jgi:Flp pilus assembly protein TadG
MAIGALQKDMQRLPKPGLLNRATRFLREETGAGLVEYCVVFFLFMTMVLGVADFGRALYADHFVSNAARDGARYAAVHGSTCNDDSSCSAATPDTGPANSGNNVIQDYVNQYVPQGIDKTQLTVTPGWPSTSGTCATTSNAPGCIVVVQVQYTFKFDFPFVSKKTINFTSVSQNVIVH